LIGPYFIRDGNISPVYFRLSWVLPYQVAAHGVASYQAVNPFPAGLLGACQAESPGVAFLGVAFREGAYQEAFQEGAFLVVAFRGEAFLPFLEAVARTFDLVQKPQLAELVAS